MYRFCTATGQRWKFYILLVLGVLSFAVTTAFFSLWDENPLQLPIRQTTRVYFLVCFVAAGWFAAAVRCPNCGKRPVWHYMTHADSREFDSKVWSMKRCPKCGFDPVSKEDSKAVRERLPPETLSKPVEAAIFRTLKLHGFKRRGRAFWRDVGGVRHLVAVQSASSSRKGRLRFTVNLAVLSETILESWESTFATSSGQWRERIGTYLSGKDQWWEVNTLEEGKAIGEEVARIVSAKAIPALEAIATTRQLLDVLAAGQVPGLTAMESATYHQRLSRVIS